MAGNNSIQILRSTIDYDISTSGEVLLDGQPFYSKKDKALYIGDGESQLQNIESLYNLQNGYGKGSTQQKWSEAHGEYSTAFNVGETHGRYSFAAGSGSVAGWTEEAFNQKFPNGCDAAENAIQETKETSEWLARVAAGEVYTYSIEEYQYNDAAIETKDFRSFAAAFGQGCKAKAKSSFAAGYSSVTNGKWSAALTGGVTGENAERAVALNQGHANGSHSIAGGNSTANGSFSLAISRLNTANGQYSIAAGNSSITNHDYAVAIGNGCQANNEYAVAMQYFAKATGWSSFAVGQSTEASGSLSFVGGKSSKASQQMAFAYGNQVKANGSWSTAFGSWNTAGNEGSFVAGGNGNTASGLNSCVLGGYSNKATAQNAITIGGYSNQAIHEGSAIFGQGNISDNAYQTIIGKYNYNDPSANYVFQIGWGTPEERKNIFTVTNSGDVETNSATLWNTLYVGGQSQIGTLYVSDKNGANNSIETAYDIHAGGKLSTTALLINNPGGTASDGTDDCMKLACVTAESIDGAEVDLNQLYSRHSNFEIRMNPFNSNSTEYYGQAFRMDGGRTFDFVPKQDWNDIKASVLFNRGTQAPKGIILCAGDGTAASRGSFECGNLYTNHIEQRNSASRIELWTDNGKTGHVQIKIPSTDSYDYSTSLLTDINISKDININCSGNITINSNGQTSNLRVTAGDYIDFTTYKTANNQTAERVKMWYQGGRLILSDSQNNNEYVRLDGITGEVFAKSFVVDDNTDFNFTPHWVTALPSTLNDGLYFIEE